MGPPGVHPGPTRGPPGASSMPAWPAWRAWRAWPPRWGAAAALPESAPVATRRTAARHAAAELLGLAERSRAENVRAFGGSAYAVTPNCGTRYEKPSGRPQPPRPRRDPWGRRESVTTRSTAARLEHGEQRGAVKLLEIHRVISLGAFGEEHTKDRPVTHLWRTCRSARIRQKDVSGTSTAIHTG